MLGRRLRPLSARQARRRLISTPTLAAWRAFRTGLAQLRRSPGPALPQRVRRQALGCGQKKTPGRTHRHEHVAPPGGAHGKVREAKLRPEHPRPGVALGVAVLFEDAHLHQLDLRHVVHTRGRARPSMHAARELGARPLQDDVSNPSGRLNGHQTATARGNSSGSPVQMNRQYPGRHRLPSTARRAMRQRPRRASKACVQGVRPRRAWPRTPRRALTLTSLGCFLMALSTGCSVSPRTAHSATSSASRWRKDLSPASRILQPASGKVARCAGAPER